MPQAVEVPDLAAGLGPGWRGLDKQDVGEGWLRILLELRLGQPQSEAAAQGWDGGQYRAWAAGARTTVDLETSWDSARDAAEFAAAMRTWLGSRGATVSQTASTVQVLFGSDAAALGDLRRAAA